MNNTNSYQRKTPSRAEYMRKQREQQKLFPDAPTKTKATRRYDTLLTSWREEKYTFHAYSGEKRSFSMSEHSPMNFERERCVVQVDSCISTRVVQPLLPQPTFFIASNFDAPSPLPSEQFVFNINVSPQISLYMPLTSKSILHEPLIPHQVSIPSNLLEPNKGETTVSEEQPTESVNAQIPNLYADVIPTTEGVTNVSCRTYKQKRFTFSESRCLDSYADWIAFSGGADFLNKIIQEDFDVEKEVTMTSERKEREMVTVVYDIERLVLKDEKGANSLIVERLIEEQMENKISFQDSIRFRNSLIRNEIYATDEKRNVFNCVLGATAHNSGDMSVSKHTAPFLDRSEAFLKQLSWYASIVDDQAFRYKERAYGRIQKSRDMKMLKGQAIQDISTITGNSYSMWINVDGEKGGVSIVKKRDIELGLKEVDSMAKSVSDNKESYTMEELYDLYMQSSDLEKQIPIRSTSAAVDAHTDCNDYVYASLAFVGDWRGGYLLFHNERLIVVLDSRHVVNFDSVMSEHSVSRVIAGIRMSFDYTTSKWFIKALEANKNKNKEMERYKLYVPSGRHTYWKERLYGLGLSVVSDAQFTTGSYDNTLKEHVDKNGKIILVLNASSKLRDCINSKISVIDEKKLDEVITLKKNLVVKDLKTTKRIYTQNHDKTLQKKPVQTLKNFLIKL